LSNSLCRFHAEARIDQAISIKSTAQYLKDANALQYVGVAFFSCLMILDDQGNAAQCWQNELI
jgi:hypothetical protein